MYFVNYLVCFRAYCSRWHCTCILLSIPAVVQHVISALDTSHTGSKTYCNPLNLAHQIYSCTVLPVYVIPAACWLFCSEHKQAVLKKLYIFRGPNMGIEWHLTMLCCPRAAVTVVMETTTFISFTVLFRTRPIGSSIANVQIFKETSQYNNEIWPVYAHIYCTCLYSVAITGWHKPK